MSLKKRKHVLFGFVVLIIVVLMFSVVGIVVLYLGNNQMPLPVDNTAGLPTDDDYVIFQDPTIVVDDEEYINDTEGEPIELEATGNSNEEANNEENTEAQPTQDENEETDEDTAVEDETNDSEEANTEEPTDSPTSDTGDSA